MTSELRIKLLDIAAKTTHDPYAWVMIAFPWGAGELAGKSPRQWQIDVLQSIGDKLKTGQADAHKAIQEAVASGHGIGKSALVSWLILWAMATRPNTKGVVTANTENQLKTKTWAEVAKWHRLSRFKEWFSLTATALFSSSSEHEKTWRVDMVPWSERNTESFAGLHNEGRRILLIFDEASAIPDMIWEVSEGALTDENTEIIWCAFGNPTRNSGRFHGCFNRFRHRWSTRQIDSRTVEGTNKVQLDKWVEDYGEDSDFVKVRVRGMFPSVGDRQYISTASVLAAAERQVTVPGMTPKLLGVDVARFGDDKTVIARRHGRKLEALVKLTGMDTMQVAAKVAEIIDNEHPDAVFVDGVGIGAGVVDRLNMLGYKVIEVLAGGTPDQENKDVVVNKRAEMWMRMRDWLEGADIPEDADLASDLTGPEYTYDTKMRVVLEKKSDMKKRGMASPDCADAVALTFAYPTPPVRHYSQQDLIPDWSPDI